MRDVEAESGYGVGFVSQSALPHKHQHFKWVLASYVGLIWGSNCQDRSNILGPDWGQVWPSCALLRYLEATALLLAAKLGDLEVGLSGGQVEAFELRYVMLKLYVRFCSAKILSGFLPAMLAPLGVKYGFLVAKCWKICVFATSYATFYKDDRTQCC